MRIRSFVLCILAGLLPVPIAAQQPPRAVRRTIPITRAVEAGLASGARDSLGTPGPRYWQLRTDYVIDAKLDVITGLLTGHETVHIANPSDSTLGVVYIRLLQNLFAPDVERAETVPELTDGIKVTRLVANGTAVNIDSVAERWSHTTIVRVRLARPIPAHGTGTLEADWSFTVPGVPLDERGERMGSWAHRLYQVAQWYPQLAMYDDLRGWNTDPHLGTAEFFNNFGSFDVHLDLPAGWLVGATGVLQDPDSVLTPMVRQRLSHAVDSDSQITIVAADERGAGKATLAGDRLMWHFKADSVADFAWATSNEYVWDATRATIPGKGVIPINLFYWPEHSEYKQTGVYARHALEFYSRLWMPYAFPQLTQVDGPEGGMEYPMFIMSGAGRGVTDHETGHEWWPMMVGVNETWYGWMDEGFNQYMNRLSSFDFRGQPANNDSLGQAYGRISGREDEPIMMWDGNYAGPMYSFTTYGKAPLMLSALGGIVGDTAVWRAMSAYAHAWRFKHPSPWDFMFAMDHQLHRDLGWFWYYWLFTTESVDGSISKVAVKDGRTLVTVHQAGEMPSPVVLRVEFAKDGPAIRPMKNAVISGNSATVTWPVDVWFGGARDFTATLDFGRRKIERITLDPGMRFPDRDPGDNRWPRTPVPSAK
ncbi:MAG TPA: M1 family metallopeptidase [Gemmatimonadales bacterium]|nr:M1 family metallopeptidase [Gemmatimonadales bacterium]